MSLTQKNKLIDALMAVTLTAKFILALYITL
jgi:hypothetical protein